MDLRKVERQTVHVTVFIDIFAYHFWNRVKILVSDLKVTRCLFSHQLALLEAPPMAMTAEKIASLARVKLRRLSGTSGPATLSGLAVLPSSPSRKQKGWRFRTSP